MIRTPGLYGALAAIEKARTASLLATTVMPPRAYSCSGPPLAGGDILSSGCTDERRRLITSISSENDKGELPGLDKGTNLADPPCSLPCRYMILSVSRNLWGFSCTIVRTCSGLSPYSRNMGITLLIT